MASSSRYKIALQSSHHISFAACYVLSARLIGVEKCPNSDPDIHLVQDIHTNKIKSKSRIWNIEALSRGLKITTYTVQFASHPCF